MTNCKTPEQIEFADLMAASGIKNQSELARRLKMTRQSISKYLSGAQHPPPLVMDTMRRIVFEIKNEQTTPVGVQRSSPHGADSGVSSARGGNLTTTGRGRMKYPDDIEGGGAMQAREVHRASEKLGEIRETDPKAFKAIESVIAMTHKNIREKTQPPAKPSKAAQAAKKLLHIDKPKPHDEPKK